MKLEFLALKWALTEKFIYPEYLLGNKCLAYTDNSPLSHLLPGKLGATKQHWAAQLAFFDFELKYWSSKSHSNADSLSHPPASSFMGYLLAAQPNEIIAIDCTTLEPSSNGLENVLVITDVFSKYFIAIPTYDQRAPTVAQVLVTKWFFWFDILSRLDSDQEWCFENTLVQQLCHMYSNKKSQTTPYHPAGNGQCERFNRILHNLLRTLPVSRKLD